MVCLRGCDRGCCRQVQAAALRSVLLGGATALRIGGQCVESYAFKAMFMDAVGLGIVGWAHCYTAGVSSTTEAEGSDSSPAMAAAPHNNANTW